MGEFVEGHIICTAAHFTYSYLSSFRRVARLLPTELALLEDKLMGGDSELLYYQEDEEEKFVGDSKLFEQTSEQHGCRNGRRRLVGDAVMLALRGYRFESCPE